MSYQSDDPDKYERGILGHYVKKSAQFCLFWVFILLIILFSVLFYKTRMGKLNKHALWKGSHGHKWEESILGIAILGFTIVTIFLGISAWSPPK